MKRKIKIYLPLIFTILLCSCNRKEYKSSDKISIDIDNYNKTSFFDIFSRFEIIPLETNDSSLIKEIDKLVVYHDNFYIMDYRMSQIKAFDLNGRFDFQINNKGNGPDQYINISDIDIYKDKLSFISSVDGTLHLYDLKGNFITKYRLPKINGAYELLKHINNDTIAFWTCDYKNRLKFYSDAEKKIFKETMPEPGNIFNNFSTPVFSYDNYIVRTIDNDVVKITPDCELIPAYEWDFGILNNDLNNLPEAPDSNSPEKLFAFASKIYSSEVINYIFGMAGGNSTYIYAQLTRKNKQINIFYNKHTKQKSVFKETIEGAKIYPLYWTENYIVGFAPTYNNLSINDVIPDKILDDKNKKIKTQLNEFDNPILIKYYLKK